MNFDDVLRTWGFGNQMMPHQLTVLHVPTGIQLTGNCKHEQSKLRLERDLTDALAILVAKEEAENPGIIRKSAAEIENENLRRQLEQMQANIQRLLENAAKPEQVLAVGQEVKGRGIRKGAKIVAVGKAGEEQIKRKGWSPEKRAAAAQRMKDRQAARYGVKKQDSWADKGRAIEEMDKLAAKIDTPAGEKTEEQLIREQMRAPNQAPQKLPKAHQSHGSVAVQVSPEALARGFKP